VRRYPFPLFHRHPSTQLPRKMNARWYGENAAASRCHYGLPCDLWWWGSPEHWHDVVLKWGVNGKKGSHGSFLSAEVQRLVEGNFLLYLKRGVEAANKYISIPHNWSPGTCTNCDWKSSTYCSYSFP
jgi:hypothetical protein